MENFEDLNFLVEKTLKETNAIYKESLEEKESAFLEDLPETTGVIYLLDKKSHKYKVKCIETLNIKKDLTELKALSNTEINKISFLETKDLKEASVLSEKFQDFKFEFSNNEFFCEKSWFVKIEDNTIVLKLGAFEQSNLNVIELGPLGDFSLAEYYFKNLIKILSLNSFETKFKKENSFLKWEFSNKSNAETAFKMFQESENQFKFFNFIDETSLKVNSGLGEIEYLSILSYFNELKVFQRFWSQITRFI